MGVFAKLHAKQGGGTTTSGGPSAAMGAILFAVTIGLLWLQPCRVRAPGELRPLGSQAIQGGHVLHLHGLSERRDERLRDERQRDERRATRRGLPHGAQVPPRSSPDGSTAPALWSSPLLLPPPPPSMASFCRPLRLPEQGVRCVQIIEPAHLATAMSDARPPLLPPLRSSARPIELTAHLAPFAPRSQLWPRPMPARRQHAADECLLGSHARPQWARMRRGVLVGRLRCLQSVGNGSSACRGVGSLSAQRRTGLRRTAAQWP